MPLLIGTLIALAVLSPAAYFWHSFMLDRSAVAYLDRAETLEKEEKWSRASQYLHRYLQMHPEDDEVHIRLAKTYDKSAKDFRGKARARELYFRAVGRAPDRVDLRQRLAELLLELRQIPNAEDEAKELLRIAPNDPVALKVLAVAGYFKFRSNQAGALGQDEMLRAFHKALEYGPDDTELASLLATIYRRELNRPSEAERIELADRVMDTLVEKNPEDPKAYFARHSYRKNFGISGAEADIERAVELGPEDFDILVAAGQQALDLGVAANKEKRWDDAQQSFDKAESMFRRAIEVDSTEELGHLGLGQTFLAQNKAGLAIDAWRDGLAHVGQENVDLNARLVTILIELNRMDEVEELLEAMDDSLTRMAKELPDPVRKIARNAVDYLRAKWHAGRGEHRETIELLKQVIVVYEGVGIRAGRGNELFDSYIMLGDAYSKLGQWDQAAIEFEKATQMRPERTEAHQRAIRAYELAGQPQRAESHYEYLASRGESTLGDWLRRQQNTLKQLLRRPKAKRNWNELAERIAQPPVGMEDAWQFKLFLADYEAARYGEEGYDAAAAHLKEAEEKHDEAAGLYQRLVLMYERLGRPEDAERALRRFREISDDPSQQVILAAELLTLRGEQLRAYELLKSMLPSRPPSQQATIRYHVGQLALQMGRVDEAYREFEQLFASFPDDAALVKQLADVAIERRDFEGLKRWEEALRRIDGDESTRWRYYQARRLLEGVTGVNDPAFTQAANLSRYIDSQRPAWPQNHLLKAQIALYQNKPEDAVTAYKQAIRFGELRIGVFEKLIGLLQQMQRFDEAEQYLTYVQDFGAKSEVLLSQGIQQEIRRGDTSKAVELARQGVLNQPNNPLALVRLGQALLMDEQKEEAEKTLRDAAKQGPNNLQVWNALIAFYLREGKKDTVNEILQKLSTQSSLPALQRALFVGRGFQLTGNIEEARQHYRQAMTLAPNDVAVHLDVVEFFAATDVSQAEAILRKLLKNAPDDGRVRRRLAALLLSRGGEKEWQEAQQLVDTPTVRDTSSRLDRRLLANMLARRGGKKNRQKAIGILSSLVNDPTVSTAGDRLLLARLYEAERNIDEARTQYLALVGGEDPDPRHVAMFVEMLLRNEGAEPATAWLRRLTKLAPESINTMRLTALWLKESGRVDEVEQRLEQYAADQLEEMDDDLRKKQFYLRMGKLYAAVDLHVASERWYQRLLDLDPKEFQPLAESYVAQGRLSEAVQLCQSKAETDDSPTSAIVLAAVLTTGKPTSQDYEAAETVFGPALEKHPKHIGLLFSMALVRAAQDRPEEAVRLYQEILKIQPRNVPALNNLAYVLLEVEGRHQEALQYIDKAIEITGRQPALLDTKGMILLEDSPQEAVQLLEEAASVPASDPRYQFHLAVALQRTGKIARARSAMLEAEANDLEDYTLTLSEQRLLKGLKEVLNR